MSSPAASAAASTIPHLRPSLSTLLLRTLPSLQAKLHPTSRLASLDLTATHISLSLSNRTRDTAFPLALLARTALPSADARILSSLISRAEHANHDPLDVHALIVGVPPVHPQNTVVPDYVEHLLEDHSLFPGLKGVLFYSEAHALVHAIDAQQDYVKAVERLPPKMEGRKLKRFAAAMNPVVPPEQLNTGFTSYARLSATDVLQAVLDELRRMQLAQPMHT